MRPLNPALAPRLLLIEPQALMRTTVAGVVREIHGVEVLAAASVASGERALRDQRFDAMLVSIDDEAEALTMLSRLRAAGLPSVSRMPVAVLAAACDAPTAARLKALDVKRVLVKPCKVRHVLETIERLLAPPPGAVGGSRDAVAPVPA